MSELNYPVRSHIIADIVIMCRTQRKALEQKIEQLMEDLESAHGGQNTGDIEDASARLEAARQELNTLELRRFKELFQYTHVEMNCYLQQDSAMTEDSWCVLDVDGEVVARGQTPIAAMESLAGVVDSTTGDSK